MHAETPGTTERHQRIMEYYPLVCSIAHRLARRFPGADASEFISIGVVGLIEAVDRFDPTRGVPFGPYAEIRIRGAIVDAMRSVDWRPRSLRRKNTWLCETIERFQRENGRGPSREELASELSITVDELDDLRTETAPQVLVSLDSPRSADSSQTILDNISSPAPDLDVMWGDAELKQEMVAAVRLLPTRERTAVTLYYLHGISLREIGRILDVTESRASQLRAQGIERLKSFLTDSDH